MVYLHWISAESLIYFHFERKRNYKHYICSAVKKAYFKSIKFISVSITFIVEMDLVFNLPNVKVYFPQPVVNHFYSSTRTRSMCMYM